MSLGLLERISVMVETAEIDNGLKGLKLYQENVSDTARILGMGEELKKGDYFHHGDCLLVQLGDENFLNAPTKISGTKATSNVVLKGNANSHALYEGDFDIYIDGDNLFVDVKTFAILDHVKDVKTRSHAEHHQQYIPKGQYFFRGIQEWDYLEKMARQVVD